MSNFRLASADFHEDSRTYHREMAALVDLLVHAGCRVVALVPNAAGRVPAALRAHVGVIEWDRTTTAASAARAARG